MNTLIKLVNRSLVLSVDHTNHLSSLPRFLNTTSVCDVKRNDIARKLGIPERPKQPPSGYFRFMQEVFPALKLKVKTSREVPALVSAQWKALDETQKQKYHQEYEREKVVFDKALAAYKENLTKEQKLAIKDERIRLKELKETRMENIIKKNQLSELGKPKRPSQAFTLFYSEETTKGKTNLKTARDKYNALSQSEKNAYKQKAEAQMEVYRKELLTWEKRMVAKGLTHLIGRSKALKLQKTK